MMSKNSKNYPTLEHATVWRSPDKGMTRIVVQHEGAVKYDFHVPLITDHQDFGDIFRRAMKSRFKVIVGHYRSLFSLNYPF